MRPPRYYDYGPTVVVLTGFHCTREISSLPKSKKVMNMACHFGHYWKWNVQWKFTTPDQLATPSAPLIEVLLIKILLFLNHLFQSNQHFQAIEFVDQPILEKLFKSFALTFPMLSSQNISGSWVMPQFFISSVSMVSAMFNPAGTKLSSLLWTKYKEQNMAYRFWICNWD